MQISFTASHFTADARKNFLESHKHESLSYLPRLSLLMCRRATWQYVAASDIKIYSHQTTMREMKIFATFPKLL